MSNLRKLAVLNARIVDCRKCPRLVAHRELVARTKRRAFRDREYWGRPVPGFGDPRAELLIIGLAPAAHGANRTGRVFTGDRSGDFLYAALNRAAFANQPTSLHLDDGLRLRNAYITASIRCAPPKNNPLPGEILNCRAFLLEEFDILRPRAVLALGKIAFDSCLSLLRQQGLLQRTAGYKFGHGACHRLPGGLPCLFAAYHPSQQNTQTGKVTPAMYDDVLRRIKRFLRSRV